MTDLGDAVMSLADAEATRLFWPQARDKKEADAAEVVSFGDESGGALGTCIGVERAALPKGRAEE